MNILVTDTIMLSAKINESSVGICIQLLLIAVLIVCSVRSWVCSHCQESSFDVCQRFQAIFWWICILVD